MTNVFSVSEEMGPEGAIMFFTSGSAATRYIRKFERDCGWQPGPLGYVTHDISDLVSPCHLSHDQLYRIWTIADRATKAGTTNNKDLAAVVAELAGIRCGEICLD